MTTLSTDVDLDAVPYLDHKFGYCMAFNGPGDHLHCVGVIGLKTKRPYRCPCECHKVPTPVPTDWTFELPFHKPLSMNDRMHWAEKAELTKAYRDAANMLARQARIPACEKIRVTLIYEPRSAGRRDPINLSATLKAVQDGIVDAKVIPDDTPQYLESPMPLIDAPIGGKHGKLWVLVERIA